MSGIVGGAGSKSGVIGTTELRYEEGTYTPSVTGSNMTGASITTSGYRIVGDMCTVWLMISGSPVSSGAEMSCEIILPLLKNSSSFQDAGTWQAWNGSGTNRVSIGLCGNGGGEQNKTWFYIQANQLNDDTVTSEWRTCFTYLLA